MLNERNASSPTNAQHRALAALVLVDAFRAALNGNDEAELWLREAERAKIFAAGLGLDYDYLIETFDRYHAAGRKGNFYISKRFTDG